MRSSIQNMSDRPIKSAERTLAVFELFSQREEGLSVGTVARELGIPQPSTTMLLRNLADLGYLEYDRATRTYNPTIRIMLLGSWISRRFAEAGNIPDRLQELQSYCDGETVYVSAQNGAFMQYIVALEAARPDRLMVTSGMVRSLTCSAAGRVLLSVKPDAEVVGWVRRCNAEAPEDRFRVREADFLDLIREVRERGYATTDGDSTPGHGSCAVPIRAPFGSTPLALGCGGPMTRMHPNREKVVAALKRVKATYEANMAAVTDVGAVRAASSATQA